MVGSRDNNMAVASLWRIGGLSFSLVSTSMREIYCIATAKNSRENFRGTLKNRENHECLAQRIFPRLRYAIATLAVCGYVITNVPVLLA